jgi:hypothetical protein
LDSINCFYTYRRIGMDKTWRWYQDRIAALFALHPQAQVESDVKEVGHDTKVLRQIDVRILLPFRLELRQGFAIEIPLKIVVDAKYWNQKLDVKIVGELASLKEDIGANLLVAVSPKGATNGAKRLGRVKGVYPIAVTDDLFGLLGDLKIRDASSCLVCNEGLVSWRNFGSEIIGDVLYSEGTCDSCGELHIRCGECGEVFAIPESEEGKAIGCPLECGAVAILNVDPREGSRSVEWYDALDCKLLIEALNRASKSLTKPEVQAIINGTRWQYWDVTRPTIDLEEKSLMEWRDDNLHLTSDGEELAELLRKAKPALWY